MPIRLTGMNSGLDTEALVSELVSAYRKKGEKYTKEQTKISWKQEAWKTMSSKTFSFRNNLDKMRFASGYNLKTTSVSNSTKATIIAGNNAVNGTQTLEITKLAKTGYLTGGKITAAEKDKVEKTTTMSELGLEEAGDISINGKRVEIRGDMKVSEVVQKLQEAGVSANFDENNQRIFISSKESGAEADFDIKALSANGADALSKLGLYVQPKSGDTTYADYVTAYDGKDDASLGSILENYQTDDKAADAVISTFAKEYQNAKDQVTKDEILKSFKSLIEYSKKVKDTNPNDMGYSADATRIYGEDAHITLNGAEFESKSNTFNINGLTINALALTDEPLTITTSTDNQGIYDKIKDFLSEYNSLINAMTASYNAASSSEYEPLTDDEKEAMSEKEIEKWESKGKEGILRRDGTLSSLMSSMTSVMSKAYTINGKDYSLSSFGIKTLGILNAEKHEQNAYHIDGDADDESTSANKDKLMAAIVEDPDAVIELFQKISNDLYSGLGEHMTSTSMRSYGKFYNDKQLDKDYASYNTKISDWEKKIADIEDSYYKKFAKMESALSKLQNQTSQLSGLLG